MDANYPACLQFVLHGRGAFKGEAELVHAPGDPRRLDEQGDHSRDALQASRATGDRLGTRAAHGHHSRPDLHEEYWAPIGAAVFPRGVDLIAMDVSVNVGPKRATEFLTKTVGLSPVGRVRAIDRLRVGWWHVCRDWRCFGEGWMSRANACLAYALKMAGG